MTVGFIGLGRMGMPMARALLRAGFPLTVFNRTAHRALLLGEAGATVVESPAEVAARSEAVITMVADGRALSDVLAGEQGLLAKPHPGLVIVDMSTVGPDAARRAAHEAQGRGATLLDAPVSGSVPAAEAATLTTIVGGDREAFERIRPVLAAMTRTQLWLGPSGAGAAMKLALNGLIAATNQAIAEALVVAERSGIERNMAYDAIAASAVHSPFVDYKRDAFLQPSTASVAFTLALMHKDVELFVALADDLGVPANLAATACRTLARARESQGDDVDFAMVAEVLRRSGGRSSATTGASG